MTTISKEAIEAAAPQFTPQVKPLEWKKNPAGGIQAIAAKGMARYRVHANGQDWYLEQDHMGGGGQSAAQADYERRILSALIDAPPVSGDVAGVVERLRKGVEWDTCGYTDFPLSNEANATMGEAADLITTLSAKLAEAERERDIVAERSRDYPAISARLHDVTKSRDALLKSCTEFRDRATSAEARLSDMTGERDEALQSWGQAVEMYQMEVARVDPALATIRALTAERDRMREAMKPFARVAASVLAEAPAEAFKWIAVTDSEGNEHHILLDDLRTLTKETSDAE